MYIKRYFNEIVVTFFSILIAFLVVSFSSNDTGNGFEILVYVIKNKWFIMLLFTSVGYFCFNIYKYEYNNYLIFSRYESKNVFLKELIIKIIKYSIYSIVISFLFFFVFGFLLFDYDYLNVSYSTYNINIITYVGLMIIVYSSLYSIFGVISFLLLIIFKIKNWLFLIMSFALVSFFTFDFIYNLFVTTSIYINIGRLLFIIIVLIIFIKKLFVKSLNSNLEDEL